MTTLKLFGCTAAARQRLQQTVDMDCCVEGQIEELCEQHQDEANQVWVVYVNAANEFLDAAFDAESHSRPPKAVLWVPQGQQPLPLDDWWEGFAAQLQEERPDDRTLLQRLSRCAQVLEWGERLEDIPQEWFATLTDTLHPYGIDDLPFDAQARGHLKACPDCRAEVYEWLQERAGRRWAWLCPTVDELAAWLEIPQEDPRVEGHVRECGLCREIIKRQASLWEEAGLLTAEHRQAKFTAVGLTESVTLSGLNVLIAVGLAWAQAHVVTAVAGALLLAASLHHAHAVARPSARRSAAGVAANMDMSLESLLMAGDPVELSSPAPWLLARVEDDTVLLQAGRNVTDRFEQFRVEFRRGEHVVVAVTAENGVARLSASIFQHAQVEGAEQVVILE